MTLQQLKYFITVAEIKNITYAAQRLYTSQPTISRQIQMLEAELGYSLFNRRSKPLKLTEPGKILYEGMKEAISQINYTLETAKIASGRKKWHPFHCFSDRILFRIYAFSSYERTTGSLAGIKDSL